MVTLNITGIQIYMQPTLICCYAESSQLGDIKYYGY
jgi:hypothetical protein